VHTVILPLFVAALSMTTRPSPLVAELDCVQLAGESCPELIEVHRSSDVYDPFLYVNKTTKNYSLFVPATWQARPTVRCIKRLDRNYHWAHILIRMGDNSGAIFKVEIRQEMEP